MNDILEHHAKQRLQILKAFDEVLQKAHKLKLKSACGIVFKDSKVLLGLSNASDDRKGKWCFAGGGIDKGEDCMSAAIRETYEEMGLTTTSFIPTILIHTSKPEVGFCVLKNDNDDEIVINEEFDEFGWFGIEELPENTHPINVDLLKLVNVKEIK